MHMNAPEGVVAGDPCRTRKEYKLLNVFFRSPRCFLILTAVFALTLSALPLFAAGESGEGSVYDKLSRGKETFLAECRKCHTAQYAIAETYSEDDWYLTVNMMVANGAQLTSEQKEIIVEYLTTKSLFETKCSVCHSIDRPLSKTKTHEEWRSTVNRMAGKKADHLSPGDIEAIAAFLALGYPEAKN